MNIKAFIDFIDKDGVYDGPERWEGELTTRGMRYEGSLKATGLVSLGNLKIVEGDLHLTSEEALEDLGDLEVVGGYLSISRCPNLKTLGRLKTAGEGVTLIANRALKSIGNLAYVGGECMLTGNNIKELTGLRTVYGDVTLSTDVLPTRLLAEKYVLILNPKEGPGLEIKAKEYLDTLDKIKEASMTELISMKVDLHEVYHLFIDRVLKGGVA